MQKGGKRAMNSGSVVIFAQTLINGISNGGVYCLIAVGLTMIVGVLKAVNFSQGDCLTLGMYITFVLQKITGLDPLMLLVPTALLAYAVGMGLFDGIIYPIMNKSKTAFTITTLGVSFSLSTALLLIFGANPLNVDSVLKTVTIKIGMFSIAGPRFVSFIIMAIFVLTLYIFLKRTDMGRAMRATAESKEISQMLGINTHSVARATFSLGIMFAGVAGLLISPTYYLYPSTGGAFNILAMCCVVIGGMGNIIGAALGAMMVGILESFIGTYLSIDLSTGAAFVLLILVLLLKPNGLLGKGERIA